MICLTGFSYGIGGDKFTYMQDFEGYPTTFVNTADYIWYHAMLKGQMPLWTMVNIVCKVLFNSFYAVQLLQSAAINISVCYIASKYTHRYFLFLLVYFFSLQYFIFNTEIMREGFAIAFLLLGMHGWMNGKKWLYCVTLPIGLLFHVSAVAVLLFPFIRFKSSPKTLIVAFIIAFALWAFSDILLNKVMVVALGGIGALVQKVMFYSLHASTIFGFLRSAITYLIFPFIIMYTSIQIEKSESVRRCKEKMISYMVILAIFASALAGFVRLYNYVQIFYLIMLADFIYVLFRIREHLLIRIGTLAGTAFLILLMYLIHYKTTDKYFYEFYYPYTCILDEDKSVYIREFTHLESVAVEESDNNVRDVE